MSKPINEKAPIKNFSPKENLTEATKMSTTFTTTNTTNIPVHELIYSSEPKTSKMFINKKNTRKALTAIPRFIGKYIGAHLNYFVPMILLDLTVATLISIFMFGYSQTINGSINLIHNTVVNPIVIAIGAFIVMVLLIPFALHNGDIRTPSEKKHDENVQRIMTKFKK